MNKLCSWCGKLIDPRRHSFVKRTVRMPNGGSFEYRYHAGPKNSCFTAWVAFDQMHDYLALVPETHEHE